MRRRPLDPDPPALALAAFVCATLAAIGVCVTEYLEASAPLPAASAGVLPCGAAPAAAPQDAAEPCSAPCPGLRTACSGGPAPDASS